MEYQLDLIHENQLMKSNINEVFENGLQVRIAGPVLLASNIMK